MSIWCQNNSARPEISETSNVPAVTIKHSHPYPHASVLAERQTLFNISLCCRFGRATKFRFVQDLGGRTKVAGSVTLWGICFTVGFTYKGSFRQPGRTQGFGVFFPGANLAIHHFLWKTFSKFDQNIFGFVHHDFSKKESSTSSRRNISEGKTCF